MDLVLQKKLYCLIDERTSLASMQESLRISKVDWVPVLFNLATCDLVEFQAPSAVPISCSPATVDSLSSLPPSLSLPLSSLSAADSISEVFSEIPVEDAVDWRTLGKKLELRSSSSQNNTKKYSIADLELTGRYGASETTPSAKPTSKLPKSADKKWIPIAILIASIVTVFWGQRMWMAASSNRVKPPFKAVNRVTPNSFSNIFSAGHVVKLNGLNHAVSRQAVVRNQPKARESAKVVSIKESEANASKRMSQPSGGVGSSKYPNSIIMRSHILPGPVTPARRHAYQTNSDSANKKN